MFDRLQKPFLTVETGEAYQPLRISYVLFQKDKLIETLGNIKCLTKAAAGESWSWYWKDECADIHFESLDSFKVHPDHPVRLGSITLKGDALYFHLPPFKRACLGVPFFHKLIDPHIACVHHVDFINKVFAIDERLPHGFTELFKDDELDRILHQRVSDYEIIQQQVEDAVTAEDALLILEEYTIKEARKRLPYAERYQFEFHDEVQTDIVFLSFYIFLRGRELVAIKRWFGDTGYSLVDAVDDTIEQVFGGMDIDIIE